MVELMDDLELLLAGMMFTVPQEFSIVSMQSSCDDDCTNKIVLKSDDCIVELRSVKNIGTDDTREKFFEMLEDKTEVILHGKVQERLAWYIYAIWAEYESAEGEYCTMYFGQVPGVAERLELNVISTGTHIEKIMSNSYMSFFIKSFEVLGYDILLSE